jgi:hypothetical protein
VLSLDLEPSTAGWRADLAARGVAIRLDDVGRESITREAARRLFVERREAAERAREAAERHEAELEAQRVASLPRGLPADRIPEGLSPAMAMIAAGEDDRPRRRTSVLEDALARGGATYHPIREEDDRWTVGGGDG